jgi:type IV pilus assembly protein PilC
MPHFTFKAKKGSEIVKGEKDAKDRFEIYRMLHESGQELISYTEKPDKAGKKFLSTSFSFSFSFSTGIKTHEKIIFARTLGSMIEAGLSVSHALTILERQTANKAFKKIIDGLSESINNGRSLSEALANYSKVFSPLFISMVRAGEQSGTLTDALRTVAAQMDSAYALQRRVRGAMTYPCIIVGVMVLIAILMLLYIVPTLTKTFLELHVELPWSTQLVVGVSNLFRNDGLFLLLGIVLTVGFAYLWAKRETGKKIIDLAITKIPVIGEIVKEVNSARTARTLASLLGSGVDIVESMRITTDIVQNVCYKKILGEVQVAIEKGEPMSKVFNMYPKFYPVFLGEMVSVGEETGKIGEMLLHVATFYEDDVAEKTKDMSTVIEPFLMVLIGAGVGFFAMAMISPMYSLSNAI